MLSEDPSPNVRIMVAERLGRSGNVPRSLILALSRDQIEVAGRVIACSPVLTDGDLVDIVAVGSGALQQFVACRKSLGVAVCAALAEIGSKAAIIDLLDNGTAHIARMSLARIAERFGDNPELRVKLFERRELPGAVRQMLVEKLGTALAGLGLARQAMGDERLSRVTQDACRNATLQLAENIPSDEMPALVEHLRISKRLSPAFLMHTLCSGNVDFFAAAIVSLSGMQDERVRSILVDGREAAIRALYRTSGLEGAFVPLFISATLIWRDASRRGLGENTGSVTARLIERHAIDAADNPELSGFLRLIENMHLVWQRQVSRERASALAAQAA